MALSTKMFSTVLVGIIIMIMIFQALGDTATDVGSAADNATYACAGGTENSSVCPGNVYPLTSFMKKKGIILLAFMAGIALAIITAVIAFRK